MKDKFWRFFKIFCLIWSILTLSLAHVLNAADLILTTQKSNALFLEVSKEHREAYIDSVLGMSDRAQLRAFNKLTNTQFYCKTKSGVDFGYTCLDPITEIIVSYAPIMLSMIILGLPTIFLSLIGLLMAIPYLVAIRYLRQ